MSDEIDYLMLEQLVLRARDHFDKIEQDVPEQSYVVGGAVRDAALGLDAQDMDFVVVGETEESMKEKGFQKIDASSFPVFHDSEREEWALARTEHKTGDGYKGFNVDTDGITLEDDLQRRDLTVNAMAVAPNRTDIYNDLKFEQKEKMQVADGVFTTVDTTYLDRHDIPSPYTRLEIEDGDDDAVLIDHHDGVRDLSEGRLRHVGEAFAEDPLRVLRVARYAARYSVPTYEDGFEYNTDTGEREDHKFTFQRSNVHVQQGFMVDGEFDGPTGTLSSEGEPSTMEMMQRVSPELNRMSRDRIGTEIEKAMLQAREPARFWRVLEKCGALAVIFPELDRSNLVPAGPEEHHYEGSTFTHSMMVLNRMHEICYDNDIEGEDKLRRLLAATVHDIGKVVVADKKGGLHSDDPPRQFGGHSVEGEKIMDSVAGRLGLSNYRTLMGDASRDHMRIHELPQMEPDEAVEFVAERRNTDEGLPYSMTIRELIDLAHADHEGRFKVDHVDEEHEGERRTAFSRPDFDRDVFMEALSVVEEAIDEVSGYDAMLSGICDEHEAADDMERVENDDGDIEEFLIDGQPIHSVLGSCDDCMTPGPWISELVDRMRAKRINPDADHGAYEHPSNIDTTK